ncbi:MAG TPA: MBL fold metallo-hydrolase [Thermomicrobiales bacterium]|jgi:phosphoribosyl 1,2-cyclic phosphate phosphodiesterase|nr:MBL fold metallo-hydrolase [Thermomicrobiales bacterium]
MGPFELTFLGTGTSNGVPMIGCRCDVCRSNDPRDQRTRSSVVIRDTGDDRTYLVDTGPELRIQALAADLNHVDAVLYTHAHADHTAGLDDLRRFNEMQQGRLPAFANSVAAGMIVERFAYAFAEWLGFWGGKPDLDMTVIDGPFRPFGTTITPLPFQHGRLPVVGFRIGDLAYLTDAKAIPAETMALLEGTEVLVINALRERPHPTHLSLAEALEVVEQIGPRETWLTHISHEISHAGVDARLPEGVGLAYDGLTIRCEQ